MPCKGRPKGAKGKFTSLRQSFLDAFEQMGGTKALVQWGRQPQNKKDFYMMVCKMLPREMTIAPAAGDGPSQLPFTIKIEQSKGV